MKKMLSVMLIVILVMGASLGAFATEAKDVYSDEAIQTTDIINSEDVNYEMPNEDLSGLTLDSFSAPLSESHEGIELKNIQTRGTWLFNDPFGIVNGNLSSAADYYIVENTSDVFAFLKLTADDPNLLALLYYVNSDGTLGNSTGFGVYANEPAVVTGLPTGTYAIIIGSADGTARGSYRLHWNRSNPLPQSNESANLLSISEDLLQIVIYYKDDKILSNGDNLVSDLEFEARRDFIVPNGYAHITSRIYSVYETGNMYTGSFSYEDFTPYSTDNALIIEIERAGYSYIDRYYQNINGDVTSWMRWEDPVTGLTTPRTLGDAPDDEYYGPHYLVIDLDTNQVVDFVSVFNYFYVIHGRIPTMSNLTQIN